MLDVKRVVGFVIQQSSFNEEGGLHVQKCLVSYMQTTETSTGQAMLDKWLPWVQAEKVNEAPKPSSRSQKLSWKEVMNLPVVISCIELTMKHDKNGEVADWMKGDHCGTEWDGSVDDQEETLEEHVSKYGWEF